MGNIYLTEMANWFREAGLKVVEYQSWKTEARSSGGYDQMPLCCMWHHTASQTSPENDANWEVNQADAAPICNVNIARDGTVWCLAAGATNTNGSGKSQTFSRGTVPADGMNSRAFGIEIANGGTGETYPQAQTDAAFVVSNVINSKSGNRPDDVCTHQVYAPDRKVDPATAAAVAGPFNPGSTTSSGTWSLPDLKAECNRRAGAPNQGDDDMTPQQAQQLADIWTSVQATNATLWGNSPNPPYPESVFGRLDANLAGHNVTHRNIWGGPNGDPPFEQSIFGRLERIEDELNKLRDQHG